MRARNLSAAVGVFLVSIGAGCAGLEVDADGLPYRLKLREGNTYFGNTLVITEVKGDSREYRPGATYLVRGRYILRSHQEAVLMQWCADGWVQEVDSEDPEPRCGGSLRVKRGKGEFSFRFKVKEVGELHLSFYPVGGGESFASLYYTITTE